MKKKVKVISLLSLFIIIIGCVIYSTISIINNKNLKTIKRVKTDFINECKYNDPFFSWKEDEYVLVGQYNEGYVLLHVGFVIPNRLGDIPETLEIGGISITKNSYTGLIYFEERLILYDLEETYNKNYIDIDDLIDIKNKLDEYKDNDYIVTKDYKVKYVLDYSKVIDKKYTKEELKTRFVDYFNESKNSNKQLSDFYLLGKYSIGYLFVNNPSDSIEHDSVNCETIRIFFNNGQEFYFYYPPSNRVYEGLDNDEFKKVLTYIDYLDIKSKLDLFKENYYLVQYDFDIE